MKAWEELRQKGRTAEAWLLLAMCIVVFLIALLAPLAAFGLTQEEERLQNAYEQGEIIRLHILAEDDSTEAQMVKLAVRDALLAAFGEQLAAAGAEDASTAFDTLCQMQDKMLAEARKTAYACGFRGSVTAETGWMQLPEKRYGTVVLPAGEYRALRITLGKGTGRNWWCVLFPQLCLALAGEEPWQQSVAEKPVWQWHSLLILREWPLLAPKQDAQLQPAS